MKKSKKVKQQVITLAEYDKRLGAIIAKQQPVAETLIELLEEAGKYQIKT